MQTGKKRTGKIHEYVKEGVEVGLMNCEKLFWCGIFIMVLTLCLMSICGIFFFIKRKKLKQQLEKEYGKPYI